MLNIQEIKKECPKAYKLLEAFVGKRLAEMQALMTQNSEGIQIDELPAIDERIVGGVLGWNIRILFDFFDENGIEIEIYKGWKYYIDGEVDEEFNNRQECELEAFKAAFKKLG